MKDNKRNSNIEMLRIFAMLGIILLHYNDGEAFACCQNDEVKSNILLFLESVAICGVDLFLLISGYFLSLSQKRSLLKPFELLFQISFFNTAYYIARIIISAETINAYALIKAIIPSSYFFILYIIVYLVSPYINLIFSCLEKKQIQRFIFLIITIFSFWATLVDVVEEILGFEWFGISPITAWGNKQGFNIAHFIFIYCIGVYVRLYGKQYLLKFRSSSLWLLWLMDVVLIYGWAKLSSIFERFEMRSAWVYHNPLVILSAVLLLAIALKKTKVTIGIVNSISAAAFTAFLVHTKVMKYTGIKHAAESSIMIMLLHMVFVVTGLYLLSWGIHICYHWFMDKFFARLSRIKIFEVKEVESMYCPRDFIEE